MLTLYFHIFQGSFEVLNAILQASTHVKIVTTIVLQYAPLSVKVLNILLVVELLIYSKKYSLQQNKSYSSILQSMIITSPIRFDITMANLENYGYIAKTLIQRCINFVQCCIDVVLTSGTVENLTSDFVSF